MDALNSWLAQRLKVALREAGLSPQRAAQELQLSQATMYRKLRGERDVKWWEVLQVASLTGRPVAWFMPDEETTDRLLPSADGAMRSPRR
jgi:hypothetical protein